MRGTGGSVGEVVEYDRSRPTHFYDVSNKEQARIVEWRLKCLTDSHFESDQALDLARRNDVDLHAVIELVEAGASHALATDISL